MVGTLRHGCEGRLAVGGGLFCYVLCKVFPDSLSYIFADVFKASFFAPRRSCFFYNENLLVFSGILDNETISVFHIYMSPVIFLTSSILSR